MWWRYYFNRSWRRKKRKSHVKLIHVILRIIYFYLKVISWAIMHRECLMWQLSVTLLIRKNYFHAIKSSKTDEALNCLAGVVFDSFNFLYCLLITNNHGNLKLSVENRLLLFLKKIKLHHSNCQRIFSSLLEELVEKTSNKQ